MTCQLVSKLLAARRVYKNVDRIHVGMFVYRIGHRWKQAETEVRILYILQINPFNIKRQ